MANVLILGGNEESYDGILHIKRDLGHKVILCDANEEARSIEVVDDFIKASIYDEEEVLNNVMLRVKKGLKIDAVLTIATDAIRTVALLAKYLGLPSVSYKTAVFATDKIKMKKRLRSYGINVPDFFEVKSLNELESVVEEKEEDLVLKPADSRGARGVIRIRKNSNLRDSFNFSIKHSKSKRLILEKWIDGFQLSTESVIWDDEHFLCGIADRNYSNLDETYPYVIENGGETPSILSDKLWSELDKLMYKSALAIGLKRGTIKGDIVVANGKIYVIEIAARLSGGYFSTVTIPEVYGNDLIKAAVDISFGQRPDFEGFSKESRKFQANRFLFLKKGVVKKVDLDLDKFADKETIKKLVLYVREGDFVQQITDHTKRCGMVLCVGDGAELVKKEAEDVVKILEDSIIVE